MKSKMKKMNLTHPAKKVLALSLSAIMTAAFSTATYTHASDIDIYQQARSGDISLMMLFDISGSMGAPQLTGNADACDIPSGKSVESPGSSPSGTTPSYTRYYCNVLETKTYKYRYRRNNDNNRWAACTNNAEDRSDCSWGTAVSTRPAGIDSDLNVQSGTNLIRESTSSYYYYYEGYTRQYPDRITRIKDAMFDLLQGNVNKGIAAVADDKIIGLSAYSFNGTGTNGYVLMPARRLSDDVTIGSVTKTHRAWLLDAVANRLYARGGTPTANAYAEAAAYMMGTKTFNDAELYTASTGKNVFFTYTSGNQTYYTQCMRWDDNGSCTYWPSSGHQNTAARNFSFLPLDLTQYTTGSCTVSLKSSSGGYGNNESGTCYTYRGGIARDSSLQNGFNYSISSAKNTSGTHYLKPDSMTQTADIKQCSGQGIYVLTDGQPSNQEAEQKAMRNALNDTGFSCNGSEDGTDCVLKFSNRLLNNNPTDLKIKTAVVGFGKDFSNIDSFDRAKTQEENLNALGTINTAVKRAAEWGIKGEGGWYSGSSSKDVVDSVNNFINDLSSEIPAVTTGTPTIPVDALNPVVLQNYAYYPQFQPTPDKTYQLWAGNLKKYTVSENGILRDKKDSLIVDASGKILDNYDLWSPNTTDTSTSAEQAMALIGGAKSQLKLRTPTNADTANRKLLTNRHFTGTGVDQTGDTLKQVDLTHITDSTTSLDPKAGSLMNLLGYDFDPSLVATGGLTINDLKQQAELRQVGAVMHSSPLLLTNQGKITYNATQNAVGSEDREDYILFGTTQGLLHVVDANTGEEKFAFVPNEMIEAQSAAFGKPELSSLGMGQMFYGVDAPWTSYTEYVNVSDQDTSETYLTVNSNSYNQTGKQLVYGGLRMGGRNYYALDLSDIDDPKLKFQIRPAGECSATNPLGCMGQSWSKPSIAYVNWNGSKKLVMFVGGGYDAGGDDGNAFVNGQRIPYAGYESDTYNQTNKRGAGVYMFDALDGSLLWWTGANATASTTGVVATASSDMEYSVVSQIRTIDRNADGLIDHLYFGDLGGQIWRIDLNNDAKQETNLFARTPTRLLNLNNAEKSPRFYETPAFSTYSTRGQIFGAVTIGSGNRSMPLVDYTIGEEGRDYDGVFNIYDKDVARESLLTLVRNNPNDTNDLTRKYYLSDDDLITKDVTLQPESTVGVTASSSSKLLALTDATRFSKDAIVAPFATTQGWYYKFKSYKLQSEKVMSTPIVINNDLYVTTFDGSKDGLAGDCGAGVKGESFMTLFGMPYGQMDAEGNDDDDEGGGTVYRLNLGAGIVGGAVGAGDGSGMQRLIVANVDATGVTNNAILNKRYETTNKLIPQRWYERR
jgi:type IV pilus assembly protein PilY1